MSTDNGYRNLPRRRFSREFKREVVELLNEEAATVAEVAREYELHPNQLFRWRTEYLRGAYGPVACQPNAEPVLVPVELRNSVIEPAPMFITADSQQSGEAPTVHRIRRLRVVLPKGQIYLEDVAPEMLSQLIEALR
jgi:Transposase and inactivated derivatives